MEKMKLNDMTREERMAHVDLSTPCQCDRRRQYYRQALIEFSEINPGRKWLVCHLCEHDSMSDKQCHNPLHLYWGTKSENSQDVCPTTGLTPAQKIAATKKGKPTANKGKTLGPQSAEHRANISAAHTGKTLSDETRAKIAEVRRKYWADRKAKFSA
jgi:hypothetical protein